jgi:LTXXQ motif family protein
LSINIYGIWRTERSRPGIEAAAAAYSSAPASPIEAKLTEVLVNRTLLAVALAAGAALAVPLAGVFAQSTNPPAGPAAEQPAAGGTQMPMMRGWPMMHQMWMRRARRDAGNPQEWCIDRLARRAAHRAYVETKLDLTAAQRPLWDKLVSVAKAEEQKEHQLCAALPTTRSSTTIVERLDRMQQFLSARLDGLKAAQPAIAALYQALTPAQRAILDQPFRRS